MAYGFKKGHGLSRPAKKIYVFKLVGVFEGAQEVNKATGIDPAKVQYLCKSEKLKDGYILSFNEMPGQDFRAF